MLFDGRQLDRTSGQCDHGWDMALTRKDLLQLGLQPTDHLGIPVAPVERRQYVRVKEKHHQSNGRAGRDSPLNS